VRTTVESLGGVVEVSNPGGEGAMTVFVARLPQVLVPQAEVAP
jgi:chemotaxis protein histidine kinase CheA